MNERERNIVIGCILGDGFLQMTGKKNARLRLEHSLAQKKYLAWKWAELKRYMQDRPKQMTRFNPVGKKTYNYIRCQSHSSLLLGKLRAQFYNGTRKHIPMNIKKMLNPLALAVWFMDDGYYYARDKTAYIYLSRLTARDIKVLQETLAERFDLHPKLEVKQKKNGAMNFKFSVGESNTLIHIIAPHVIKSMRYKIGEEPRID